MIINLRNREGSVSLRSKLVWQELFNDYRNNGGDLTNVHDLLCDLKLIENLFHTFTDFTFYWRFGNHITDLTKERETHRRQLKVQFTKATQSVEITVLPSEVSPLYLA